MRYYSLHIVLYPDFLAWNDFKLKKFWKCNTKNSLNPPSKDPIQVLATVWINVLYTKGPNPEIDTALNCQVFLISFIVGQFLSPNLTFMTLTYVKITG